MRRQILTITIPLFAGICLSFAAVKTDYDHQADFNKYKTYSWISTKGSNDLWSERILQDVDAQLQARGWSKGESAGDATVSAFGRTQSEQTLRRTTTDLEVAGVGAVSVMPKPWFRIRRLEA